MDGPALFQANLLSSDQTDRATDRADLHPTIHRPPTPSSPQR